MQRADSTRPSVAEGLGGRKGKGSAKFDMEYEADEYPMERNAQFAYSRKNSSRARGQRQVAKDQPMIDDQQDL